MSATEQVASMSDGAGQIAKVVEELKPLGMVVLDLQDLATAQARWLPLLEGVKRSVPIVREIAERVRATNAVDANALAGIAAALNEFVSVTYEGRLTDRQLKGDGWVT